MNERKSKSKQSCFGVSFLSILFLVALLVNLMPVATLYADQGVSEAEQHSAHTNTSLLQRVADHLDSSSGDASAGRKPKIRPHLYVDNSYNSNASQTRKPNKAWQARVTPGVTIDLPISDKLFTTNDFTYSFASTQGQQSDSHANTFVLDNLVRYDVAKDTTVGVRNNSSWNEVPGTPGRTYFVQTNQVEGFHRYGSRLDQNLVYTYQHYKDPLDPDNTTTRDSFNDHGVATKVGYRISEDLKVSPGFSWNKRSFKKNQAKGHWQIHPSFNAEYALGRKTTLGGRFGWAYRRFEDDGYAQTLTYGAGINHLLSRKLVWSLDYDKNFSDTFNTNFVFRPDDTQATNLDVLDRNFRVVTDQRIGTGLTYNLNERNSFGAFGDIQFISTRSNDNVVMNTDNDEKKMELGSRYGYRITKNIAFNLVYTFGRNFESHNNPAREQYVFHKVSAGVNVTF